MPTPVNCEICGCAQNLKPYLSSNKINHIICADCDDALPWCTKDLYLDGEYSFASSASKKHEVTFTFQSSPPAFPEVHLGTWNKSNVGSYPTILKHKAVQSGQQLNIAPLLSKPADFIELHLSKKQENSLKSDSNYNGVCPKCGAKAYIGLFNVDCSNGCK